jgi:hypothetical protein
MNAYLFRILVFAIVTGAVGFSAGFFGPMFLVPDANQGPLLGILITGPLGILIGGLIGLADAHRRSRKH